MKQGSSSVVARVVGTAGSVNSTTAISGYMFWKTEAGQPARRNAGN